MKKLMPIHGQVIIKTSIRHYDMSMIYWIRTSSQIRISSQSQTILRANVAITYAGDLIEYVPEFTATVSPVCSI